MQIVSIEELQAILSHMQKLSKREKLGLNEYDTYIYFIRKNRQPQAMNKRMKKHHIIPRFDGGGNMDENLIFLTVKEHVIAHWIRYKSLNKTQDLSAYLFRIGNTEEALKLRDQHIKAARDEDRIQKRGFFCSKFQSKMGHRGGSKGGSADTEEQFLARQKVGLNYGRITVAVLREHGDCSCPPPLRGSKNQRFFDSPVF